MNRRAFSGFTLLELLMVITIIGILLAIIIPVTNDARERARSAKCVANLKQLHTAVLNYYADKSGIPAACSTERQRFTLDANGNEQPDGWAQSTTGWVDWCWYDTASASNDTGTSMQHGDLRTYWYGPKASTCITNGTLYGYARGEDIYVCPSFQSKYRGPDGEKAFRSYVMNSDHGGKIQTEEAYRRILFADGAYHEDYEGSQEAKYGLRNTSQDKKIDGDGGRRWWTAMDGMLAGWKVPSQSYPKERVGSDHHGKGTVVFLDGHCEKVRFSDTTDVCTGNWGEY